MLNKGEGGVVLVLCLGIKKGQSIDKLWGEGGRMKILKIVLRNLWVVANINAT